MNVARITVESLCEDLLLGVESLQGIFFFTFSSILKTEKKKIETKMSMHSDSSDSTMIKESLKESVREDSPFEFISPSVEEKKQEKTTTTEELPRMAQNPNSLLIAFEDWKPDEHNFHRVPKSNTCSYCKGSSKRPTWDTIAPFIFCISLKDEKDRVIRSSAQFHALGMCSYVSYYRPARPTMEEFQGSGVSTPGSFGCQRSHKFLSKYALDRGANRCLVFEDDIVFMGEEPSLLYARVMHALIHLQTHSPDWNMFLLGHVSVASFPTFHPGLLRGSFEASHAYLINKPAMQWLVASKPIDMDPGMMLNGRQYALFPSMFIQENLKSETGQPAVCLEWNRFLNRHWPLNDFLSMFLPVVLGFVAFLIVLRLFPRSFICILATVLYLFYCMFLISWLFISAHSILM